MHDIDYGKVAKDIQNWKGFEKEYWKSVEIVEANQVVSVSELKILKAGLSIKSREIITAKFKVLKEQIATFNKRRKPSDIKKEAKTVEEAKKKK